MAIVITITEVEGDECCGAADEVCDDCPDIVTVTDEYEAEIRFNQDLMAYQHVAGDCCGAADQELPRCLDCPEAVYTPVEREHTTYLEDCWCISEGLQTQIPAIEMISVDPDAVALPTFSILNRDGTVFGRAVEFPNGKVAVAILGDYPSIVSYDNLDAAVYVHCVLGGRDFVLDEN